MRARLIVFPIRGRKWCFSRSMEPSPSPSQSSSPQTPATLKELWGKISSSFSASKAANKPSESNVEVVIDFAANKMNRAWTGLENAPAGSFKSKLHGLGVLLLSRVKPSEIFLRSITKEVTNLEITYPSSLNGQLVRRRLRHIAFRGTIVHRKFFYGSASLLPITSVLAVLPLPNIPFFWVLFRTYSHWRALKGSEKLFQLVSDHSIQNSSEGQENGCKSSEESGQINHESFSPPWILQPSEELEEIIRSKDEDGLSKCTIEDICRRFNLNTMDVLKYKDMM